MPYVQTGEDKTEYYLLTKEGVSTSEFEGKTILKVSKEALTQLTNTAFRDVNFLLRRSHNEQVAKILSDPEASDNDRYVALTFLVTLKLHAKAFFLSAKIQVQQSYMERKVNVFGPTFVMKKLFH